MDQNMTRRDFIRISSASAAGATVLSMSSLAFAMESYNRKAKVVIAKDDTCVGNQVKIQDMVDYAVIRLTGVTTKGKAYEALFSSGVTATTKILIKYNNSRTNLRNPVLIAIRNGLTSMLDGTFPALPDSQVIGSAVGGSTNQTFKIGESTYAVRNIWEDCDYFINMPSCWAMSISPQNCGVTLSLKAMMPAVNGTLGTMHSYFTSDTSPALSIMNSQPVFKRKQALVLIDAIAVSPSGSGTKNAYSVIASKDGLACDYNGIQTLKSVGGFSVNNETAALKGLELAAKTPYSLGTNDPNEMEVIHIGPPFTTEIITSGSVPVSRQDVLVTKHANHASFAFLMGNHSRASIEIHDMRGKGVWVHESSDDIAIWRYRAMNGRRVSQGAYVYRVKNGPIMTQGILTVQ